MKKLITLTFMWMVPLIASPASARDSETAVVILIDSTGGTATNMIASSVSGSSAELVEILLSRLLLAERRAAEALANIDSDDLLEELRTEKAEHAQARAEAEALAQADLQRMEVLSQQVSALRGQVGGLQELVNRLRAENDVAQAHIEELETELDAARQN